MFLFFGSITGSSSNKMDSSTSGNVDDPELEEKALLAPQPVRGHAVDDRVDQREETVGVEVAPEANPTIVSYNAMGSPARFENRKIFFFEKHSSLLHR
jgi:hypothetical protein